MDSGSDWSWRGLKQRALEFPLASAATIGRAETDRARMIWDGADILLSFDEGPYATLAGTPGGADTQVQYNDGGAFAGDAGFTYDGAGGVTLGSQLRIAERVGDPAAVAGAGFVYVKDVAGTAEQFFRDDAGNVVQITSGGAVNAPAATPGGANTQVQFNNAGAFGGDAGFTYDGAGSVALTAQVALGTDLRMSERVGDPANVANTGFLYVKDDGGDTELFYEDDGGAVVQMTINGAVSPNLNFDVPDNDATAYLIESTDGFDIFRFATLNGAEVMTFGNAGPSPWDYLFLGTNNITLNTTFRVFGVDGDAVFGATAMSGTERLRVVGAARVEGTVTATDDVTIASAKEYQIEQTGAGIITAARSDGSDNLLIGNTAAAGMPQNLFLQCHAVKTILLQAGSTVLTIDAAKATFAQPAVMPSYTVAGVPSAATSGAGATIFVTDETGGATLAYSDAVNWRRTSDRAVIS